MSLPTQSILGSSHFSEETQLLLSNCISEPCGCCSEAQVPSWALRLSMRCMWRQGRREGVEERSGADSKTFDISDWGAINRSIPPAWDHSPSIHSFIIHHSSWVSHFRWPCFRTHNTLLSLRGIYTCLLFTARSLSPPPLLFPAKGTAGARCALSTLVALHTFTGQTFLCCIPGT